MTTNNPAPANQAGIFQPLFSAYNEPGGKLLVAGFAGEKQMIFYGMGVETGSAVLCGTQGNIVFPDGSPEKDANSSADETVWPAAKIYFGLGNEFVAFNKQGQAMYMNRGPWHRHNPSALDTVYDTVGNTLTVSFKPAG